MQFHLLAYCESTTYVWDGKWGVFNWTVGKEEEEKKSVKPVSMK